ncbi:hypothetical protein R1sor_024327 [Riccia sorocarpa]|uniref:Uncharacterized protein n=1 Tax=Riccia sorocarpa TaxID=122646 RepID=A0ABD3GUA6_9MARC
MSAAGGLVAGSSSLARAEGRGGCALLINARLRVSETGTSGFGGAAWANVHVATGTIKVASIHAPNVREERITYWEWWDRQIEGEDCIVAGDFKNVELPDDSKGKSALIRGTEERASKTFKYRAELVDAYVAAVKTTGGPFTRMAFCGQRYDQARLDRFYLSNDGEWCECIHAVNHHSEQTLSDHIPVSLQLQLVHDDNKNWRPKSYFKMSTHLVKRPGIIEKFEEAWGEHPYCRSTQKQWDLGWGRLRQILKEEKAIIEKEDHGFQDLRREVEELRLQMEEEGLEGGNKDLHTDLQRKEAELREQDLREAQAWKCRSKEKWLKEGEAPSRYFYTKLKAKFSRERIAVLEREDGSRITGHHEILMEIEGYYKKPYTREEETEDTRQARHRILQKITKKISTLEDVTIYAESTEQERISLEAYLAMKGTYLTMEETDDVERDPHQMLKVMDWGLSRAGENLAYLLLVLSIIQHNWGERNEKQFTGRVSRLPPGRIIDEVQQELQVIRMAKSGNEDWEQSLQAAADSIKEWHESLSRRRPKTQMTLKS